MLAVIDSNYLQNDELRTYLAKSKRNLAVLSDYIGVEAAKVNALVSLPKSMAIVGDFPNQVVVLRGTRYLFRMHPRPAGLRRRMIDQQQTNGFADYIRTLRAGADNRHVRRQLLEQQRAADDLGKL